MLWLDSYLICDFSYFFFFFFCLLSSVPSSFTLSVSLILSPHPLTRALSFPLRLPPSLPPQDMIASYKGIPFMTSKGPVMGGMKGSIS